MPNYATLVMPAVRRESPDTGEMDNYADICAMQFTVPDSFQYRVYRIGSSVQGRPDLISQALFGSPDKADIICRLNGIEDMHELRAGEDIIVPTSLTGFVSQLSESDSVTVSDADAADDIRLGSGTVSQNYKIDETKKTVIY